MVNVKGRPGLNIVTNIENVKQESMKSTLTGEKTNYKKYKDYYVVYVSHPAMPSDSFKNRGRKRHLAKSLEGKSLCNMLVQFGEEDYGFNNEYDRVRKPRHGAHELCAVCYKAMKV